ncbi:hypothetical protein B0H63DRAFT_543837 [Podospora didyma]|uniref:Uncharacterized protein n=1 Tax=Podospora didyma TaxID=330526 RepID=A0AAE0NPU6_9PEZI|nr:hypothetical protein B0H63DRAFT_543837 [Podospora didyma]
MADADAHLAKARAELDRALAKLSDRLAESASSQRQSPPLTWEKLSSSDVDGLILRLESATLDYGRFGARRESLYASLMGVPVSAITNGTCYIMELVIKQRDRKDLFLAKLDHISYQARRVQEMQRYLENVLLLLLREKALSLLTAITLFLDGAIDYFTRSLNQITQLQFACEEYDQALLLQVASTILRRSHQTAVVSAGDDAKTRDWLQPSAAENESRMMASLAQRAKGTLQWVLRMPELGNGDFVDASAKARTLWLTGLPGYPDDVVLSFFCKLAGSVRLRDSFSDLKVDPILFFTSRANGIFLWVSVVPDVLERAVSTKAFQQSLDEIHPTINSIHGDVFKRAEQRGSLVLIMEVLRWTAILPTPFTVRQMALAVEISLGDKVLNMEEFLRTECGAFLTLVPRLRSTSGASSSEESLEVTIGHETFQVWLADRLGRTGRQIAHAKAATACLSYLLRGADQNHSDSCLRSYALERWRSHVRHSMHVGDRQFAEPLSVLAAGLPISPAEAWIKEEMERESYDHRVFWEAQRTCMEVAAWCRANKDGIADQRLDDLGLEAAEASRLKTWRDSLDNPQVIAQMLWPLVYHAWLWNTSAPWWSVYWNVEGLHQLYIYAHGRELFEKSDKTEELLKEESNLHGTLTTHFANVMIKARELKEGDPDPAAAYECLESTKAAGRYSDLSGVCAANLSIFFYEMWNQDRVPVSEERLQKALDAIQEAIGDDPDGSPRNYCHLGKVYRSLGSCPGADKGEFRRMALDAYGDAAARDLDHTTGARGEVYQAEEDALRGRKPPALDAAVELLESAIVDDPENSRNKWYHHLFDWHNIAEKRLAMAPHAIWGNPLRHVAHRWMGEVALYQQKYAMAVKEFKTAVKMEEEELAKEAKGDAISKMLSEDMAHCLLDLGTTYDRMGRSSQAAAVFKKALPHVEHVLREKIKMRETNDGVWRREGRWHMLLA